MKTKKKSSSKKSKSSKPEVSALGKLTKSTDRSKFTENTWVVFRGPSGERKPMLFSGKLSRDRVRSAYARITGTSHDRTRSRRLRNY